MRLGADGLSARDEIARRRGISRAEAARQAIAETAARDRRRTDASFHPEIELDEQQTSVLCEVVGAIDARNLGRQVAHLSCDELRAVDDGLRLVLDFQ